MLDTEVKKQIETKDLIPPPMYPKSSSFESIS